MRERMRKIKLAKEGLKIIVPYIYLIELEITYFCKV
jgi:hypothetical protein